MRFNLKTSHWPHKEAIFTLPERIYAQRRARIYTGLTLTLATISFFAFFALRPTILTIARLVADIKQKEEVAQKYDQKIQQLAQAQAAYGRAANQIYLIDEALPTDLQLEKLLGSLESETQANQASLSALKFNPIVFDQGGFAQEEKQDEQGILDQKEISFDASWEGQYQDLKTLLANLFNLRRLVASKSFTFFKPKAIEEEQLGASVQFSSYFQPKNPLTYEKEKTN